MCEGKYLISCDIQHSYCNLAGCSHFRKGYVQL